MSNGQDDGTVHITESKGRIIDPIDDLRTRLAATDALVNILFARFLARGFQDNAKGMIEHGAELSLPTDDQERYRELVKERVEHCATIIGDIRAYNQRNATPPSPPKPGWFKRFFEYSNRKP